MTHKHRRLRLCKFLRKQLRVYTSCPCWRFIGEVRLNYNSCFILLKADKAWKNRDKMYASVLSLHSSVSICIPLHAFCFVASFPTHARVLYVCNLILLTWASQRIGTLICSERFESVESNTDHKIRHSLCHLENNSRHSTIRTFPVFRINIFKNAVISAMSIKEEFCTHLKVFLLLVNNLCKLGWHIIRIVFYSSQPQKCCNQCRIQTMK